MTVLDQLLEELRTEGGPIRSTDLARRIGVSEPALEGMIGVLAAKGVLSTPSDSTHGESVACSGVTCGTTCVGLDECPFIAVLPMSYTLVEDTRVLLPRRSVE